MRQMVSEPRLSPYLKQYEGNEKLALRLYAWNLELSSAYWGPLSVFEVALRNRVQQELPYSIQSEWMDAHLCQRERYKITDAKESLERAGKSSPTADDYMAEISLGFWVGLFDHGRPHDRMQDYDKVFWQPYLHKVFPNREGAKRRTIHGDLSAIRNFRNRVAHHEPIWKTNHVRMIERIIVALSWIDLDAASFVELSQRVSEVLDRKQEAVSRGLGVI